MNATETLQERFKNHFEGLPTIVVRAPGRVNLIGEHTDYNDGFVMPMAIQRATWIALNPREDARVRLVSLDHNETLEFPADAPEHGGPPWGEYPKGVARALLDAGYRLKGWNGVTSCDVPMGAGLSSSASFELAIARAFAHVSDLPWDAVRMALLCRQAENQWVGVNCGIMDQLISACGRTGHALLIDCRTLEREAVPLPKGFTVMVMDTNTRRGLVDSAYNERRNQCEEAAAFFGVSALRDVAMERFEREQDALPALTRRRARHVITENARTLEAAEAMRAGDAEALGRLMNAGHASLRDDFEVSSEALDTIVSEAQRIEGCVGARMTGAGFGGCAVALVRDPAAEAFLARLKQAYKAQTGLDPLIYPCRASEGASVV